MSAPREVVDNLLRKKPAERVALMGSPWSDAMVAWVKQGYPTKMVYKEIGDQRWKPEDGMWEDVTEPGEYVEPVSSVEHFGYDMEGMGPWFDPLPIIGYSEIVEETDEWEVRRNGAGASLKYWKHKMGTPEHIDFRMTSREIWERDYRPHLLNFDIKRLDMKALKKSWDEANTRQCWKHFGHMFIWELMRQSMGDVTMYTSLVQDPAWIHDFARVYTDLYKMNFKYIFENIGIPDGIWLYEDLGYKNGLFASPKVLKELIFPYFTEMVDFFHSYDLPVVLHTCGSTAQAMPLIIEAGFDGVNPMERKAKDNEPFIFAEKYGDKIAFVGGFDVRILESNDRDLIRKEIIRYLNGMKSRKARLVFAEDHSLPPTIQYDTYRFALDVYRENMMY